MKIVCDSNIIISALLCPGGLPDKIFRGVISSRFQNYISSEILSEILRILHVKFKLKKEENEIVQKLITGSSKMVYPVERLKIIKSDDADNRVLECALSAKVDYLITGDKKHLLPLKKIKGIRIVSPRDFALRVRFI